MRIPILSILLACGMINVNAQNVIQITGLDSSNITSVLSSTIFGGCVQISNITYSGLPSAFGVFVALIPGTAIPIAINSVNDDPNCQGDYSQYYVNSASSAEMAFDGL